MEKRRRSLSKGHLPKSALVYVLESLVPYTEANLKLSFSPGLFFNDLESISRQKSWQKQREGGTKPYKRQSLRGAFYRATKQGLIMFNDSGQPRLTDKGRQRVKPYKPSKLIGSKLMVVFDIPESDHRKRRHLRLLLKELGFTMIQRSVWTSSHDHRDYLMSEIKMLDLKDYVRVYECAEIM